MAILWLNRQDVVKAGGGDPALAVSLIEKALVAHASGESCQPLKPYLKIPNDDQSRRIIAMPAYLGQDFQTWGLKWIASAPNNPTERGIERASAVVILNDLLTGYPVSIMEGAMISATRTAAVALVAAKYLSKSEPTSLSCLGNGLIGGMITRSLLRQYPSIGRVALFDQNPESARRLGESLDPEGKLEWAAIPTAEEAVEGTDLVVTATTAAEPYLGAECFSPGSLFINSSLRDPYPEVLAAADKVVVDDWSQVNRSQTVIHRMSEAGDLDRESIHGELHELISGEVPGRENDEEKIVVCPMGLPVEDIATAWGVYERARELGLGMELDHLGPTS